MDADAAMIDCNASFHRRRFPSIGQNAIRGALAQLWLASGRAERNRHELHGGATGLRIVTFHETPPGKFEELERLVNWAADRFPLATPEDADALCEGRFRPSEDRLLFTCDDGMGTNHAAAQLLWRLGIRATFFIVPSLLNRTLGQFVDFHERFGVKATPPISDLSAPGLTTSQVHEIRAMGHRIGAHNFAHRDLGPLVDPASLHYEIDRAVDAVSELVGAPCRDFAFAFGQPDNVSPEAARHLASSGLRVYACFRGLNVASRSPRFLLRHGIDSRHPFAFTRVAIEGGADHLVSGHASEMARRAGRLPPFTGKPAE